MSCGLANSLSYQVGGKWVSHEVHRGYRLNMSDARPMDCSLALDEQGRPHVAYYEAMPKMSLVYAHPRM